MLRGAWTKLVSKCVCLHRVKSGEDTIAVLWILHGVMSLVWRVSGEDLCVTHKMAAFGICVEVMVSGTTENEGSERSGVRDEE